MWFEVMDWDGIKRFVNINEIATVRYLSSSNATEINLIHSERNQIFIEGDYMTEIKRLLSTHGHDVCRIGG